MRTGLFVAIFFSAFAAIFFSMISGFVLSGERAEASRDRARARRVAEHKMAARLLRLNI